jgi:hypothetical protein
MSHSSLPSQTGASANELRWWRHAPTPNPTISATSQTFYGSSLRSVPRSRHNPMGSVRVALPGDYVSPAQYAYLAKWFSGIDDKSATITKPAHLHADWAPKPTRVRPAPVAGHVPNKVCQSCFVAKPLHLVHDGVCVDCA